MKKTLIKLCSIAAIGLALSACNNDNANKTAMDSDNSAVDQLVQDKIKTLDDSLVKVCEDQVTLAATAKLEAEAPKGGTAHAGTTHHTAPATKSATKKDEPKKPETKADKMGGNSANSGTSADKASKMGGSDAKANDSKSKASKMGGN